ncbi:MAG: 30S ribosomal protein S8 [Armatimonadetes bacterium 13_1_40CM_3_65_7]|nr:MAG: 30S ribosomal protein S8 [Armatimonadetes bacterium 13_1_40CM_3_65_7]
MLTRIRNALVARSAQVTMPASRMKLEIAKILKAEGFIADYHVEKTTPEVIRITLRYGERKQGIITGLRRISRPGLRIYAQRTELPRVQGGLGVAILSTSRGVMTDREARRTGVGGEVLCFIW